MSFMFLPDLESYSKIEKGWSNDLKFKIETKSNEKFLLRLSPIKDYEVKKNEFKILSTLSGLQLNLSEALDFGECEYESQKYCFILLSWVGGNPVCDFLITKTNKENHYELGRKSGEILKKLHSIEIPLEKRKLDWFEHFNKKISRNIDMSLKCGIDYPGRSLLISYLEQNRHELLNRPISFQHGDYHLGNMLINQAGELGIIDFNRMDFDDPWEEFNRITWCANVCAHFARGRIDGYFKDEPPEKFFKLLLVYIASNMLSSVPWAMKFGQDQVDIMLSEIEKTLKVYNNLKTFVPRWYSNRS